jgi:ABC-type glutathione transport system ATPase component
MNAEVEAAPPPLVMRAILKRFGGVQSLRRVDFDLHPGEIHASPDENGAGKSTLMNTLLGVIERDAGDRRIDGRAPRFADPSAAQAAGIATIVQATRRVIPPSAAILSYRPSTINRSRLRNKSEVNLTMLIIVPLRDYGRGSKKTRGHNKRRTMLVGHSAPQPGNTTRRKLNDRSRQ